MRCVLFCGGNTLVMDNVGLFFSRGTFVHARVYLVLECWLTSSSRLQEGSVRKSRSTALLVLLDTLLCHSVHRTPGRCLFRDLFRPPP